MCRNTDQFHGWIFRFSDKLDMDFPERNACFCYYAKCNRCGVECCRNLHSNAHSYEWFRNRNNNTGHHDQCVANCYNHNNSRNDLQRQQHDDHREWRNNLFVDAGIIDRNNHYSFTNYNNDLYCNGNRCEWLYEYCNTNHYRQSDTNSYSFRSAINNLQRKLVDYDSFGSNNLFLDAGFIERNFCNCYACVNNNLHRDGNFYRLFCNSNTSDNG